MISTICPFYRLSTRGMEKITLRAVVPEDALTVMMMYLFDIFRYVSLKALVETLLAEELMISDSDVLINLRSDNTKIELKIYFRLQEFLRVRCIQGSRKAFLYTQTGICSYLTLDFCTYKRLFSYDFYTCKCLFSYNFCTSECLFSYDFSY